MNILLNDEEGKSVEDKSYKIWERKGGNLWVIRRELLTKAQLKKVVEDINKVLVKYSVIDGKLSAYIDGTTPLWALPNIDWQSLQKETE